MFRRSQHLFQWGLLLGTIIVKTDEANFLVLNGTVMQIK